MSISIQLGFLCLIPLSGAVQSNRCCQVIAEPWGRIRSFLEQDTGRVDPLFAEYLESLTTEDMLLAARQACEEVRREAGEMRDMPSEAVAELYVMVCLHQYFAKTDRDKGGAALLKIVSDRTELPFLRRALISRMWERDEEFDAEFQTYVTNNEAQVTGVLTNTLKGPDDPLVRTMALRCLGVRLGRQVSEIIRTDPDMAKVLIERRKHTNKVIHAAELVRSGEVTLTEDTMKALAPVEARTVTYVKVLGAILAGEGNEPEELRRQAKRMLEGYRKSALTGIDDEVEKALVGGGE